MDLETTPSATSMDGKRPLIAFGLSTVWNSTTIEPYAQNDNGTSRSWRLVPLSCTTPTFNQATCSGLPEIRIVVPLSPRNRIARLHARVRVARLEVRLA